LASLQRTAIMTSDKFKGVRLNLEPGSAARDQSNNAEQEEAVDELDIDYGGEPHRDRLQRHLLDRRARAACRQDMVQHCPGRLAAARR
jgi:DNA polymerase-3 subunit beta